MSGIMKDPCKRATFKLSILCNVFFLSLLSSPIFEEDTPSVMEIEMEELDKWMNSMNKNGTR